MMAVHRLQDHNTGHQQDPDKSQLAKDVEQYKNEAERVGPGVVCSRRGADKQEDVQEVFAEQK